MFVGTVGAGKSTQIRLLASNLETRGFKVRTTPLKTGHLLAYLLAAALARIAVNAKHANPITGLVQEKPHLFKSLFKLWLILDLLSIHARFLLTVYLPAKMRRVVIVEEYIPAVIADYVYLTGILGFPLKESSFALNLMLRLLYLCGCTQTIFLDAHNSALEKRWSNRNSLEEKSDYLQMQRNLLLSISKRFSSSFLYIDTSNKTIRETHDLIVNHLVGLRNPEFHRHRWLNWRKSHQDKTWKAKEDECR